MSFVVITLGFIMFNIVPTHTADPSYGNNDGAYHLASSADVQQNEDVVEDLLQKDGADQDGAECKPKNLAMDCVP